MARIFYRERVQVGEGDQQPRFAVVGVEGTDMIFFQVHLRQSELDAIARAIGAELVLLPRGAGEHEGKRRTRRAAKKIALSKRPARRKTTR